MNKRRSFFGTIGAGLIAALALLPGTGKQGQVYQNSQNKIASSSKQKSTPAATQQNQNIKIEEMGGLPLYSHMPNYGMSPKEYGMRYGNGGSKKSNKNRYAHNAKVKRRKSAAC